MIQAQDIQLTPSTVTELPHFFRFQLDPEGQYMAAFMPENPNDEAAYLAKFTRLLADPEITMRTIWMGGKIIGSVSKFVMFGDAEITYWIDRNYWGKGVATTALAAFLDIERTRPLHARVAWDNIGSQRVLEKCGFARIGSDRGYANAREAEIEEYIYCRTS